MPAITQAARPSLNAFDRILMDVAPGWARNRIRARLHAAMLARHYEAAAPGRRTSGWQRNAGDANAVIRPSLVTLRNHARDLCRNNSYAKRAKQVIKNNSVGWGIRPKAEGATSATLDAKWKRWAGTTECDADGRLTYYGLQALVADTVVESGEVLIRRRWRRVSDGLTIPLQLQVLEPDFIDINRDGIVNQDNGNAIIQGIEFDRLGRRVAYWLYERHPGSYQLSVTRGGAFVSKRVPAEDIIHVYELGRPGQVRGVTWFAPIIVNLKDFDEYEDASLMQAKVAALFAAIVTDTDGAGAPLGEPDAQDQLVETMEPGMMLRLPPGKDVKFGVPPVPGENGFSQRTLRRIAAGFGVTYEDLTADFSQVNFSSARMARLSHWANVYDWQWNMLIPLFCDGTWRWAMEAASVMGIVREEDPPLATWTTPPIPMIEPDKEGLALSRLVRAGARTPSEVVREQGRDFDEFVAEYAKDQALLDKHGIVLDSDARKVTQSGQAQADAEPEDDDAAEGEGEGEKKGDAEE